MWDSIVYLERLSSLRLSPEVSMSDSLGRGGLGVLDDLGLGYCH
ncbi:MAG: hypothetical protein BAJATHORv1_20370 [Candidatus Thorarchaeota archaeon]|nr:MAG: hypothetical protein BAJATHORv1_20370 [Candidatus Thorarchaeota archaeon]